MCASVPYETQYPIILVTLANLASAGSLANLLKMRFTCNSHAFFVHLNNGQYIGLCGFKG